MHIWVDADSCPNIIKDILFRASNRTKIPMTLVANQPLKCPPSPFIKSVQVGAGFDIADNYIVQCVQPNDLVITADVPLADAVVLKGARALNPRGELYSETNIKQRLSVRNFSENLRSSGMITKGPDKFTKQNIQNFANNLDKILLESQRR
jgi:uncharacterized protein YaiI (UPF0178 family)